MFALVHAEPGEARVRAVSNVTGRTLSDALEDNVDIPGSTLYTDQ